MNKIRPFFCLIAVLCFFASNAHSKEQSCDTLSGCHCNSPDPSPAGIMIGHPHPAKTWMLSYRYMLMGMSGVNQGTQPVDNAIVFQSYLMSPEKMTMNMHMLMLMYGFTNRFSVMAMLNFTHSNMSMTMPEGVSHMHTSADASPHSHGNHHHSMGFGDTKLYALFALIKTQTTTFTLSGGVSIPTGQFNLSGESGSMFAGSHLPYAMQAGSGTVDFMPSLTFLKTHSDFTYSFQATSTIRPFYNKKTYNLGNEFTLNAWTAYELWSWMSVSVRAEGTISGKIKGNDKLLFSVLEPSADAQNYGGHRLSSFLGINFHILKGILPKQRLSLEGGIPVYQNLNGIQQPSKFNINIGYGVTF